MSRCKSCGAEIVWVRLKSGKSHPCNPGYWRFKEDGGPDRLVTLDGRIVAGTIVVYPEPKEMGLPKGMISHFATCPAANSFRRGRSKSMSEGEERNKRRH